MEVFGGQPAQREHHQQIKWLTTQYKSYHQQIKWFTTQYKSCEKSQLVAVHFSHFSFVGQRSGQRRSANEANKFRINLEYKQIIIILVI